MCLQLPGQELRCFCVSWQDCLDALQRAQEPLSQSQLEEMTGHDCSNESELAQHLAKNPKIGIGEGKYRFRVETPLKL